MQAATPLTIRVSDVHVAPWEAVGAFLRSRGGLGWCRRRLEAMGPTTTTTAAIDGDGGAKRRGEGVFGGFGVRATEAPHVKVHLGCSWRRRRCWRSTRLPWVSYYVNLKAHGRYGDRAVVGS